jgi:hypothetical protein
MNNIKTIKIFTIGVLTGACLFGAFSFTENGNDAPLKVLDGERLQYKWYPPATPSVMSFAGEKVPLGRWDVKERMDREIIVNTYAHSHLLYILKLSSRIFPELEKRLRLNGIPEDFKYLCVAESSLQNPTSSAGAVGYWQFMRATALQFGLEINDEVDERYDLDKATDAACQYLKQAYNKFGTWTAAAASYNCGMGGFSNQSTFQQSDDYYDLLLPEETNRYVFRILALKAIIDDPEKYGYYIPQSDAYSPVRTRDILATSNIPNLAEFALHHGTTYKILKILNPWLRDRSLTINSKKSYILKLPAD